MVQTAQVFDIKQTFEQNTVYGPFWTGKLPKIPQPKNKQKFLGHSVNSLFGVAASPMTFTARGIELYSKLGYDIITYRSVRSKEWRGLGFPNWAYVDIPKPLSSELFLPIQGSLDPFSNPDVSMANSFGIQSFKPEYWQAEFERAQSAMSDGQLLMLALMITPEEGRTAVQDVKEVTSYAVETSAKVFEINLACPNAGKASLIYEDIETSLQVCEEIKKQIGSRPLLAKIGYFDDKKLLREFLTQTKGVIDGITSINTWGMSVKTEDDKDFFPGRASAGVSGAAIRDIAMDQVKLIKQITQEIGIKDFSVIGVGGVTKPEHIQQYFELGANAVQSVTGAWADPLLAVKWKESTQG